MGFRVETAPPVTTFVLDRPEARNAVDPATARALTRAVEAFELDAEASAAVLFGAGGVFCAGADLKAVASGAFTEPGPEAEGPMGPTRRVPRKPVIAAVAGHAVAGGLELALWCDLRVAEEDAVFGVFCRRWGVPLIDGGTVRLPRLIGQGRALDMILTGRPVGAAEALAMGLVDRVVPKGAARAEAEALAREIARFPQTCLREDRLSVHEQADLPFRAALANEARRGAAALAAEAAAGARRFVEGAGRHGDFS